MKIQTVVITGCTRIFDADDWAKRAVPFFIQLGRKDNRPVLAPRLIQRRANKSGTHATPPERIRDIRVIHDDGCALAGVAEEGEGAIGMHLKALESRVVRNGEGRIVGGHGQ